MRTLLIVLFIIHVCIHFMGFARAYGYSSPANPLQYVSKPLGLVWLLVGLLLITTVVVLLFKKEWWPILGILTILISQILIVIYWKDAKFGTIVNIILLFASISSYGVYKFNQMIEKESHQILETIQLDTSGQSLKKKDIDHLPPIVQQWLIGSGVLHKEQTVSVRLQQKGTLKTSPTGKWMPFTAQQYFNCSNPSFVWVTKVRPLPMVYLYGRDKLINAQGEMLIKLFALFPVVNEGNNEKIDAASMQRYLAEMCWFPSAAISDHLTWEIIDETSVKATLTLRDKSVSGIFTFSKNGVFHSFETKRYYSGDKDAILENWFIEALDYKVFNGIKIPSQCQVTWKLKEGYFSWLKLDIVSLEYNKPYLYQ